MHTSTKNRTTHLEQKVGRRKRQQRQRQKNPQTWRHTFYVIVGDQTADLWEDFVSDFEHLESNFDDVLNASVVVVLGVV